LPLPTVVEEYIIAAIRHAVPETDEDGTVGAYVPEIPGLVAFGGDVHECARNLYMHLEEWLRRALTEGWQLPVLDGVDLASMRGAALRSYAPPGKGPRPGTSFFENEAALEEAFRHFDEVAALQAHGAA
jgi:predicted RNase H-like HicB family nuclease